MPAELEGALRSLYRSYERSFEHWQTELAAARRAAAGVHRGLPQHGRVQARVRLDRRAPTSTARDGRSRHRPGQPRPVQQRVEGEPLRHARATILVDSAQLESGEAIKTDFQQGRRRGDRRVQGTSTAAATRAPTPTAHRRGPAARGHEHRRQAGSLGEHVRCVVSVSMLTEGWDANTVTHILGVRRSAPSCCASRWSAAACADARTRSTTRACSTPSTPSLRHPVRVHPLRQATDRTRRPPRPRREVVAREVASTCGSCSPSSTGTGSRSPTSSSVDLDAADAVHHRPHPRCRPGPRRADRREPSSRSQDESARCARRSRLRGRGAA